MTRGSLNQSKQQLVCLKSAYDEFASTIKKMEAAGYTIDPSKSSNFLIDVENGRINIVDPIPVGKGGAGLNDMVVPLIGNTYMHNYKGEPLTPAMASIFSKAEQAAKNAGLDTTLSSGGEWSRELAGLNKKPVDPVSELDQAEDELAGLLGETTGEDVHVPPTLPKIKPDSIAAKALEAATDDQGEGVKFVPGKGFPATIEDKGKLVNVLVQSYDQEDGTFSVKYPDGGWRSGIAPKTPNSPNPSGKPKQEPS